MTSGPGNTNENPNLQIDYDSIRASQNKERRKNYLIYSLLILLVALSVTSGYLLLQEDNREFDFDPDKLPDRTATLTDEEIAELIQTATAAFASITPTPSPSPSPTPSPTPTLAAELNDNPNFPNESSDVDRYFTVISERIGNFESVADINAYWQEMATFFKRVLAEGKTNLYQEALAQQDLFERALNPVTNRGADIDPMDPDESGLNFTLDDLDYLHTSRATLTFRSLFTNYSQVEQFTSSDDSDVLLELTDDIVSDAITEGGLDLARESADGELKYALPFVHLDNLKTTFWSAIVDTLGANYADELSPQRLQNIADLTASKMFTNILGNQNGPIVTLNWQEGSQDFSMDVTRAPYFNVREIYDGPSQDGEPGSQNAWNRCVVVNDLPNDSSFAESWHKYRVEELNNFELLMTISPDMLPESIAGLTDEQVAEQLFQASAAIVVQWSTQYTDVQNYEAEIHPDPSVVQRGTILFEQCAPAPAAPATVPEVEDTPEYTPPEETPEYRPTPPNTPQPTPQPSPTPEEKSDPGDQTDPDGETDPDPEGGNPGDDNGAIGSGR